MKAAGLVLAALTLLCVPARASETFEIQVAAVGDFLRAAPAWRQFQAPPVGPAGPVRTRPVGQRYQDPGSVARAFDEAIAQLVESSEKAVFAVLAGKGVGSGFIVSADGLAVTNAHVVQGAAVGSEVEVRLYGRAKAQAVVLAKNVKRDLALLRLKPERKDWPFLGLGDSRRLKRGQTVVALGSPRGLHESVTRGIISATNRTKLDNRRIEAAVVFIQTDASINPGNSGGPLLTLDGTVAGINTQIYSESGGSEGLGFAISADDIRGAVEQFRRTGNLDSGVLGVAFDSAIDPEKVVGGASVAEAMAGLPAAAAGLQAGDVVTAVNGQSLGQEHGPAVLEAVRLLARYSPGESVVLDVKRQGSDMKVTVQVAVAPPDDVDELKKELEELRKRLNPGAAR